MTDLKRTVAGVALYAATTDPAKVEKIKAALDAAMRARSIAAATAGNRVDSVFDTLERLIGRR